MRTAEALLLKAALAYGRSLATARETKQIEDRKKLLRAEVKLCAAAEAAHREKERARDERRKKS